MFGPVHSSVHPMPPGLQDSDLGLLEGATPTELAVAELTVRNLLAEILQVQKQILFQLQLITGEECQPCDTVE